MKKGMTVMAFAALASTMSYADITSVALEGTSSVNMNLTTEGTTDWVMLGQGGSTTVRSEKAGASFIGAVSVTGTHAAWNGHPSRFDWTDGDTSGTGTATGNQELGDWEAKAGGTAATTFDQALTFSVNGLGVGDYTMMLYTSSYKAAQLLTASIGASSMTASHGYSGDVTSYSVNFSIGNVSDVLDISFNRNDNNAGGTADSNVAISAITIQSIPEPATLGLVGLIGGGLLFIRRRFVI